MPIGCAMMTFVLAARRSLAERPSRISCVSRLAAVSASWSVAGVGDAGAVEIGRHNFLFLGQRLDLRRRAVDEHDADVQRPQHRHVQQQRGEVFVGDDRAVHGQDERPVAELRNVLQDAPQVGRFHVWLIINHNAQQVFVFRRDSNNYFLSEMGFNAPGQAYGV